MIIKINGLDNELVLNDAQIGVIEINDIKLYRHILEIINNKVEGIYNNELFILSDKYEEIDFKNNVYLLNDIFNIDINSKKIINKIYNLINSSYDDEEKLIFSNKIQEVKNNLIYKTNEFPFTFSINNDISILDMLKLFNFKVDYSTYTTLLEKIELLIDVLVNLNISRILIIPNLKMYLTNDELIYLYKYSLYNNITIITIERYCENSIDYEKKLLIDKSYNDYLM